ncbi:hypothetical protein M885DRAFT_506366 [Pelagophyceae sp. CCMP2097]|nr:hypothetical protein M885DRAFT_506366 [Pelagophyceae sp. CCMP2097]
MWLPDVFSTFGEALHGGSAGSERLASRVVVECDLLDGCLYKGEAGEGGDELPDPRGRGNPGRRPDVSCERVFDRLRGEGDGETRTSLTKSVAPRNVFRGVPQAPTSKSAFGTSASTKTAEKPRGNAGKAHCEHSERVGARGSRDEVRYQLADSCPCAGADGGAADAAQELGPTRLAPRRTRGRRARGAARRPRDSQSRRSRGLMRFWRSAERGRALRSAGQRRCPPTRRSRVENAMPRTRLTRGARPTPPALRRPAWPRPRRRARTAAPL